MKNKSLHYYAILMAVTTFPVSAATVLSSWTFEGNAPGALDNSATGPLVYANAGFYASLSSMQGVHTSTTSDWSSLLGNGSSSAYSANNWGTGDSYQFITKTTGYSSITIAFDQIASNTGPKNFSLLYSLDGLEYFNASGTNYAVANPSSSWNATTRNVNSAYSLDLSGMTSLNDQSMLWLRLAQVDATSVAGGTVTTAGTSRIDNISIIAAIPEPSATLLGALALPAMLRRRRSTC